MDKFVVFQVDISVISAIMLLMNRMEAGGALILTLLSALLFIRSSHGVTGKGAVKMDRTSISTPAFAHNGAIPPKYTCDDKDINPPLVISGIPAGAKSLALIVDDPDAPRGTWVHWVLWNIGPATTDVKEDSVPKGAVQGINDFGRHAYGGPCPPSGTHRYFFKLYTLDTLLNLGPDSRKADLEKAMQGHIISEAQVVGLYKRR